MYRTGDIVWIDFETTSPVDLRSVGTAAYVAQCRPVILAYAIGEGPVQTWHNNGQPLPAELPADLMAAFGNPELVFAAWNAGFDRAVWNSHFQAFLEPEDVIDVMAQAAAFGLPPGLDDASRAIGGPGKDKRGRALIRTFSLAADDPLAEEWQAFLAYALQDVMAMRLVYQHSRPLSEIEWRCYWAAERINERGIPIDVELVEHAQALAKVTAAREDAEIRQLTGIGMTQVGRLAQWVHARLPCDARAILETVIAEDEHDDDEEAPKPAPHLQLTRAHINRLLLRHDLPETARRPLELRQYGGGVASKKFARMLAQQIDGRLHNQFVFNGASQTGRFSGRGVQLQNLTRNVLDSLDGQTHPGAEYEHLCALADGGNVGEMPPLVPTSRKLALLVRPMLAASPRHCLVWGDWSQIEARVLPWLAQAESRLDIFREVDADPKAPDLYTRSAATMAGVDPSQVTKEMRQVGKVSELALGFGGGAGALQRMATAYGLELSDKLHIVKLWRHVNPWAPQFWSDLWTAAMQALSAPGLVTKAGRVGFRHDERLNRLWLMLPSGRPLCYPGVKRRLYKDPDSQVEEVKWTFRRAHGIVPLWHGTFCENATQAVAADILRQTLLRLTGPSVSGPVFKTGVVGHVHDEIITECPDDEDHIHRTSRLLWTTMIGGFAWTEGLPLAATVRSGYHYSKVE